ncbi:uncharacterized protein NP_2772A [Natronomonas pharaonis DSM 2160]|uniref:Uncharacterized protein n=1 Tax=Natronomonas pharaonis (strain ATCC 35678 / DSM 2160 / CIP 103997 / JCM 8858 / NBRC 14720 / NCIMB 2260 / Gabara) TaxID=348780 RepID=A0A1U7EWL1_NATPD|nr:hypothetical protein [Natronomonas pharaonis]CAI49477.1 uncharacterized protein NP_2772A [Natronomonas pharaonis DSM 2160]
MVENHTPYEYGDADIAAIGEEPPHERQHGSDMVIVDGAAMSYRSYTRAEQK